MHHTNQQRQFKVSRRTFLRGVGVTMALPWLESVPVWGAETAGEPSATPKRFAALFMGNGINGDHWSAKGAGAAMELSKTLEPLAPFKKKLNVINGLFNKPAVGVGIHPGQTGNILSGMPLMKGAVLRGGISMDQVLANTIGQESMQSSLVLGCEQPITGYHETNFSMAYSSHISWQNADSPVPMEVYPSLAFDSLFENRGDRRTQSILDRVKDDASSLSRKISSEDNRKLDEYLASVREVEKRVDRMRRDQTKAAASAKDRGQPLITMKRPDNGLPEDIRDHMKLMCDIVALGFQTDKTRVATLVLCRDLSGCSIRSSASAAGITPRRTTICPTTTSASRVTTWATSPTSPRNSTRCPRAKAPSWTTPACFIFRTCGPARGTTTRSSPCSPSADSAARWRRAACSTTPTPAMRDASYAACISR